MINITVKDKLSDLFIFPEDLSVTQFNVNEAGFPYLLFLSPKIRKKEIEDFEHRTLKFYIYETSNGIKLLLIRNALILDQILASAIIPDGNKISYIYNSLVMILGDTHKDKVCSIRRVDVEIEVMEAIVENISYPDEVSAKDMRTAFDEMLSLNFAELEKNARYIGCSTNSSLEKNIIYYCD